MHTTTQIPLWEYYSNTVYALLLKSIGHGGQYLQLSIYQFNNSTVTQKMSTLNVSFIHILH